MKLEETTLKYCIDAYERGWMAVLGNGKLLGFEKEEIPTQTANPSGDK